jgi:hypothetical protein
MPALPVVAAVLKVVFSGTIGTYNWANVYHCQYTGGPPDVADLNTFTAALAASWNTNMAPNAQTDVTLTKVTATDLASTSGAEGTWAGTHAGTGSGQISSANASILVNFPSSFRYRGGHPRVYLVPASAATLTDAAHWNTTIVGDVLTGIKVLLGLFYTSSYSSFSASGQCAVSYVSTAITPTPPHRRVTPLVMPISQNTMTVVSEVASQRRRIGRK